MAADSHVSGIDGQNIYLDKALTGAASGNATFTPDVAKELTIGQAVTVTGGQSGPDAFPAGTTVTGIEIPDSKNSLVIPIFFPINPRAIIIFLFLC